MWIYSWMTSRDEFLSVWTAPTTWWRRINDVFAIWPHGEEHLITFLDRINGFYPSIKFTANWSSTSVTFLGAKVTIDDKVCLVTDLHVKPPDTHQYLHRHSCHPRHCKPSISYSQALRIRRICTRTQDYVQQVNKLKGFLINRGYDKDELQTQIDKATRLDMATLLQSITQFTLAKLNRLEIVCNR